MKTAARKFQDLTVWQKAHQFVMGVYELTKAFPKEETYGLTSQLRRAAVSVPANIVEGFKKKSRLEKIRFYNIAQASLEECRYYLMLAHDLNYLGRDGAMGNIEEVSKLLDSYLRAIVRNQNSE